MAPAILLLFNRLLLLLNFNFTSLRIQQRIAFHNLHRNVCTSHLNDFRLFSFNSCFILHGPLLSFNFDYAFVRTITPLAFHTFRYSRFTVIIYLLLLGVSNLHIQTISLNSPIKNKIMLETTFVV